MRGIFRGNAPSFLIAYCSEAIRDSYLVCGILEVHESDMWLSLD